MTARVGILAVNRSSQALDRSDKELAILLSGFLQVADKLLKLIGHEIKRIAKVTKLSSTGDSNPLGEVARRYAMRAAGQLKNRMRQFLCKENTDKNRQQRSDKAYPHRLPSHVGN